MGVVYFSIIPTFEPSRYCKCWIVCFYNRNRKERDLHEEHSDQRYHEGRKRADHKGVTRLWWWL